MSEKQKPIELAEATSDEAATPTPADAERARVRASESSPLIAALLDAEVFIPDEEKER